MAKVDREMFESWEIVNKITEEIEGDGEGITDPIILAELAL